MFIKLKEGKVKPGKLNMTKVSSDKYPELDGSNWDEEILTEIAVMFKLTKSEVRHIFIMYRRFVAQAVYGTSCTRPLHNQYTGYAIPGFGYYTIDKHILYNDLHNNGIIDTEYAQKMVGKKAKLMPKTVLLKECKRRHFEIMKARKITKSQLK